MPMAKAKTLPKESPKTRPPIVVILGHVDHGKTSILDKIRETKVAEGEAGGITQHIGAYQATHKEQKITFLDTPGHEAFTAIRSRGAKVADIAVLVVAADEGVKPQTKEAVEIIQKAEIPFIVAINKIDKEAANPDNVKQALAELEVFVEGYGGQVPVILLSAKTGQGIDELLEMIALVAELEELPYHADGPAKGILIESRKDPRRGIIANAIVQEGTLRVNEWIIAGHAYGRIKSLENFLGKSIREALPSEPCSILGWDILPHIGQIFESTTDRAIAEKTALAAGEFGQTALFERAQPSEEQAPKKIYNLIIKADVNSSLEAIDYVLKTIQSEEVDYKVISYGVGNISASDIKDARTTGASVIGFHVVLSDTIKLMAERERVFVKTFDIIYELVATVREQMSTLLEPIIERTSLGRIKILGIFKQDGRSQIVGGKVTQGKAVRGEHVEVMRNSTLIASGRIGQLQQAKADVTEVAEGFECGLRFDPIKSETKTPLIALGDVLEIFHEEIIKRSL